MISIISIIFTLIIIGVALYLMNLIPMDYTIRKIIYIIVIILVAIWLLQTFGIIGSLNNIGIR